MVEPVSMADVAARARVSISTVSRALGGAPGVSEATRQRIRSVADELAYVVSPEASALSRGSTGRVGILVPGVRPWYYASIVAGLERVLRAAGLDVMLYQVEGSEERDRFFHEQPARRRVDALVVVALPMTAEQRRSLDRLGMSLVFAGSASEDHPCVAIDDVAAAASAVDHLIALGHERIAMISALEPDDGAWRTVHQRVQGYRRALTSAGFAVRPELLVTVPWGPGGGARGMDQLLMLPDPPTAVFAYSDEVAVGALRSLRRARVDVPGAMSVIGLDDHPMADLTDLTTVEQSPDDIGRRAARLVLDSLGVGAAEPAPDDAGPTTHLVVRQTTAPPRPLGVRLALPGGGSGSDRAGQGSSTRV